MPTSLTENAQIDLTSLVHLRETMRVVLTTGRFYAISQKCVGCGVRMNDDVVICIVMRCEITTPDDAPVIADCKGRCLLRCAPIKCLNGYPLTRWLASSVAVVCRCLRRRSMEQKYCCSRNKSDDQYDKHNSAYGETHPGPTRLSLFGCIRRWCRLIYFCIPHATFSPLWQESW